MVDIPVFGSDGAVIGGRRAVEAVKGFATELFEHIIVDLSALSIGISFPVVRWLIESARIDRRAEVHVMLSHEADLDSAIVPTSGDSSNWVFGFSGGAPLDENRDAARLWLPQLAPGRRAVLSKLHSFVDPADTCPIIPFPASRPRAGDELAAEFGAELEGAWAVDSRNFVFADEDDPLDVYRIILRLDDPRTPVSAQAARSLGVLSPHRSRPLDFRLVPYRRHGMSFDSPSTFVAAGYVALDLLAHADPTRPITARAGGTSGNLAAIMASQGWRSVPLSRLAHDAAGGRVREDLAQWGVDLRYLEVDSVVPPPMIVQRMRAAASGPTHRFSWSCPRCGHHLPEFRALTRLALPSSLPVAQTAKVFFFDRTARANLELARAAVECGALVVFEPAGRGQVTQFREALDIAHVVKYADERFPEIPDGGWGTNRILEVNTRGSRGLRYRRGADGRGAEWVECDAPMIDAVVDTCGAGDWCTAGLLSVVGAEGRRGLAVLTNDELHDVFEYAQALAAWNCGFEGARGGMYDSLESWAAMPRWPSSSDGLCSPSRADRENDQSYACPSCAIGESLVPR